MSLESILKSMLRDAIADMHDGRISPLQDQILEMKKQLDELPHRTVNILLSMKSERKRLREREQQATQ